MTPSTFYRLRLTLSLAGSVASTLTVPAATTWVSFMERRQPSLLVSVALCTVVAIVVFCRYDTELLRHRRILAVAYTISVVLAIVFICMPNSWVRSAGIVMTVSALGYVTLLIPGILRSLVYFAAQFHRGKGIGLCDALSAAILTVPEHVQAARDALKFPIAKRRWKARVTALYTGGFVVAFLVYVVTMIQYAASATVVRGFSARRHLPEVLIAFWEKGLYFAVSAYLFLWITE